MNHKMPQPPDHTIYLLYPSIDLLITGPDDYRGSGGPLHVTRGKLESPLFGAFLEAGQQAGYPLTDDVNGYQQEGFGQFDLTIYKGIYWFEEISMWARFILRDFKIATLKFHN